MIASGEQPEERGQAVLTFRVPSEFAEAAQRAAAAEYISVSDVIRRPFFDWLVERGLVARPEPRGRGNV